MSALKLRARCPSCGSTEDVRRQGKTWRLFAHKRTQSRWPYAKSTCPVKDIDALPLIVAWIAENEGYAQRGIDAAQAARVKAEDDAAAARDRLAAYRALRAQLEGGAQ